MSWTATFSNPERNFVGSGGLSANVPVAGLSIQAEFGTVSAASFFIRHDVAGKYGLETDDANNPCQLNSTVVLTGPDGASWFRGFVISRPLYIDFDEGRHLQVECLGTEGVLMQTLCPYTDGSRRWTEESESFHDEVVPLVASSAYGDFSGDTLWPNPVAEPKLYLHDSVSNSDVLDTAISSSEHPSESTPLMVILSTSDAGFLPRGWLKINSEWMYYDGYDDTAAGNKYRCRVTARAQLGSVAANHSVGATVYNKVAKQIAPGRIDIHRDGERLRYDKEYVVLWREGGFVLNGAASGTYTGEYSVYDEDGELIIGSTPLTLESVVKLLVKAPNAHGGAGFADAQLDFDTLNLKLNRYDYDPSDKPEFALAAIEQLLQAVGLEREVRFWYDHTQGKLRLAFVANAVSPALSISGVTRIEKESNLDDVYSGVLVEYSDDQAINRVNHIWSNHTGCTTTGLDAKPDQWYKVTANGESWNHDTGSSSSSTLDSNFGMDMLHDGKAGTKLLAHFQHNPGGPFVFGDFWFGEGTLPPSIQLDAIDIRVNNYRAIEGWGRAEVNPSFTYMVRVQGCNDYDTSIPGSAGSTWRDLFELEGKPEAEGVPELHTVTSFPAGSVNAVRVVFDYMAGPKQDGNYYWAAVHDLAVRGKQVKYEFVQTSSSEQLIPEYLYVPESHKKLRGGALAAAGAGAPRCAKIEIGPSSQGAALSVGRAWLRSHLRLFQMRHYETIGELSAKPELGDTIAVAEDAGGEYTGVCYGYSIAVSPDERSIQFKVLNTAEDEIE